MKKLNLIVVIIMTATTMITLPACDSAKHASASKMLKFNFQPGKGYDYDMTMTMNQDIMGHPVKMDMAVNYSIEVDNGSDSIKTLTCTYGRFKMDMDMGGQMTMNVDTDRPVTGDNNGDEKNPMNKMEGLFDAIKGQKFVMKVNPEGKVLSVTGFENMGKTILDSLHIPDEQRADIMQKFSQQFNEGSIKEQFERVLCIFPNKEVKVGDTWEKKTNMGGQMNASYNSTYTVKGIDGDMVTLEEKSKIEGDDAMTGAGVSVKGDISGTLLVDSKTGLVVNGDQQIEMNTSKNGMGIDMKINSKTKGTAKH